MTNNNPDPIRALAQTRRRGVKQAITHESRGTGNETIDAFDTAMRERLTTRADRDAAQLHGTGPIADVAAGVSSERDAIDQLFGRLKG